MKFRMTIQDAFYIAGRGMVVTGLLNGEVKMGDAVTLIDKDGKAFDAFLVTGIEYDRKLFDSMNSLDYNEPICIGVLLRIHSEYEKSFFIGKTIAVR